MNSSLGRGKLLFTGKEFFPFPDTVSNDDGETRGC